MEDLSNQPRIPLEYPGLRSYNSNQTHSGFPLELFNKETLASVLSRGK